jgi:hypothetical protein
MMNPAFDVIMFDKPEECLNESAIEEPVRRVGWRNHKKKSSDEVIARMILAFRQGPKLLECVASLEW